MCYSEAMSVAMRELADRADARREEIDMHVYDAKEIVARLRRSAAELASDRPAVVAEIERAQAFAPGVLRGLYSDALAISTAP